MTIATVHFADGRSNPVPMREVETVWDGGLGIPMPVHAAFSSSGVHITDATPDDFHLPDLALARGRGQQDVVTHSQSVRHVPVTAALWS
ncbi:MAG: hypothetical protein AAFY65_06095 [Pseudomonadota bacterium]